MVEVLAGFGIPTAKIADVLDIDQKTLFKYFDKELRVGSAKVEAQLVGNLLAIAKGKDGAALKAIMFALNCRFGWSQYAPQPHEVKPVPLGKKEQANLEAQMAHEDTDWGELVH
jgi:hypothetical protein